MRPHHPNPIFRNSILLVVVCMLLSFAPHHTIVGTWETTNVIRFVGGKFTKKLTKGDWGYYTMKFSPNGSLVIGGKTDSPVISYKLQNDTLRITAVNGHVSIVPILKLTGKELQTLDLLDSSITIFRRVN